MAVSAVLDITHGPSKGTRFTVTPSAPIGVGRGSDNGPGKIKDSSISRVHGEMRQIDLETATQGQGLRIADPLRKGISTLSPAIPRC